MFLDNVLYGHSDFTIIVECYYYVHIKMETHCKAWVHCEYLGKNKERHIVNNVDII